MPVTFGSVGDIIAVCLLVKDLAEALDKARGSKAEYQSAIRELWILDRTLLEIELFTKAHESTSTPELRGICETARVAALRCKKLVSTFLLRVKKYQTTFDEGQDPGIIKDAVAKVRWRFGEKEALEQFRVEMVGTSSSLQMLLAAASVNLMKLNRKENEKQFESLNQQNSTSNIQQSGALEHIRERIESTQQQVNTGNTILSQITNTLRLDWLRQLGSELKGLMRRTIALNVATYHAVISIQAALPNRLERVLIEEPFILEDPIGRIAPVHLQFVTSWEAFHAVMEHRFSNLQGFKKIQQRKYELQDRATRREIEQTRSWQRAFLPGQRVEMAFIFQSDEAEGVNVTNTSCPGCQTPSEDTGDTEIHCQNCLIWYRRITVVQEVEPTPLMPLPQPWKTQPKFGQSDLKINISGPVPPGRKRVAPDDLEGEEDVREFKRVRLMRTKQLLKQRQFGVRGSTPYTIFTKLSKDSPSRTAAAYVPHWEPREATSQHSRSEQPQVQVSLQLPELPECFRTSKLSKDSPSRTAAAYVPHWEPREANSQHSRSEQLQVQASLQLPGPTECFGTSRVMDSQVDRSETSKSTPWKLGKGSHVCIICGETFSRELGWKYHEANHRGEIHFTCPECGRKFTRLHDCKRHLKLHVQKPMKTRKMQQRKQEEQVELEAFLAFIVKTPLSPLSSPIPMSPRETKLKCDMWYLKTKGLSGKPLPWSHTVHILMTKRLKEEALKLFQERFVLEDRLRQSREILDVHQEEQDTREELAKPEIDHQASSKMGGFDKTANKVPVVVARLEDGDGAKRRRLKLSPLSDLEL